MVRNMAMPFVFLAHGFGSSQLLDDERVLSSPR